MGLTRKPINWGGTSGATSGVSKSSGAVRGIVMKALGLLIDLFVRFASPNRIYMKGVHLKPRSRLPIVLHQKSSYQGISSEMVHI